MIHSVNTTHLANPVSLQSPQDLFAKADQNAVDNGRSRPDPTYNDGDNYQFAKHVRDAGKFGVGALAGYKYHGTIASAGTDIGHNILNGGFKDVVGSIGRNSKLVGSATANAVGIGALLGGGFSLATNIYGVATKKESVKGAVANVVTDTMGSALGAAGGVAVGGTAALALSAFKVTGTPLVVAGVIGGAVGSALVNRFAKLDNLNERIRDF